MVPETIPLGASPQPDGNEQHVDNKLSSVMAEQAIKTAMLLPFDKDRWAAISKRMNDVATLFESNETRALAASALAEVANYGTEEEMAQARQVAMRHVPYLIAAKDGEDSQNVTDALGLLLSLIKRNEGLEEIAQELFARLHSSTMKMLDFGLLGHLLSSNIKIKIYKEISTFLEKLYGEKKGRGFLSAWRASQGEDPSRAVQLHLEKTIALGGINPKVISSLNDDFGIQDFGRYPEEMLIKQYEERDNIERPYGVIVYPYSDNNGAFNRDQKLLQEIYDDLSSHGYLIRILECATKTDLVHRLIALHRKYGQADPKTPSIPTKPIRFLILGGHGNPVGIRLGPRYGDEINTKDIKRGGISTIARLFSPEATVILQSCSTGAWEGIGDDLSRYANRVYAPSQPTGLKTVKVTQVNPLRFAVSYENKGATMRFPRRGDW